MTNIKTKSKVEEVGRKEFRYQFLGYEVIGTGKYEKHPMYSIGQLTGGKTSLFRDIEVMKTVAMVFDKQDGMVRQTEIKKL